MSARDRVVRAARALRLAGLVSAALRGIVAGLLVMLAAMAADVLAGVPLEARRALPATALAVALFVCATRVRRLRWGTRPTSIALWIEDRVPSLKYALVTAIDPAVAGVAALERAVDGVAFEPTVWRAARRSLVGPVAAVLAISAVLIVLPHGVVTRAARARAGDSLDRSVVAKETNPLLHIAVRITPPAYSGLAPMVMDDPPSVRALSGSLLVVEGRVGGGIVHARLGESDFGSAVGASRWRVTVPMPASGMALRLLAGKHERLVALEPQSDSPPVVALSFPERDSTWRRPPDARLRLAADLSDDIGLASGAFEVIVSSGSGENFTFRQRTVGATALSGRTGALAATLALDSLRLEPGDFLHIRAIARDRNDVSGPGVGVSETRTMRVARRDEYDSVAVDAAPPPEPEKNGLSQRMLLALTEALERRRAGLVRVELVDESRRIAADQARLRKRVGEIVFHRLGGERGEESGGVGGDRPVNPDSLLAAAQRATGAGIGAPLEGESEDTPLIAVNRPLLEAYNLMWQAGTELEVGEPGRAIPWMRKALDAIQSSRSAERIYLRGRTGAVVVDVERVRLQGKDKGAPAGRTPREPIDPARASRLARFDFAISRIAESPSASVDSLVLLRLDLLDVNAVAARALDDAANTLRGGRDATFALVRARRALAGAMRRRDAVVAWGGAW